MDTITQNRKGNFGQVLGNIKRCSDRNMAPIRQTIKSSLKLSKHSQVQPLHYSASAFQNFYNSTVKLRTTVFRNLLHFNVNHLRYTNFTDFLHFNVRDMRLIRPFLDKFRLWKKKDVEQFAQESFLKKETGAIQYLRKLF